MTVSTVFIELVCSFCSQIQLYGTSLYSGASCVKKWIVKIKVKVKVKIFIVSLCILYFLYHWSLGNQTRCVDVLFLINKPSTTNWAYTDSNTLTYSVTRNTTRVGGGGISPCKATNLVSSSQSVRVQTRQCRPRYRVHSTYEDRCIHEKIVSPPFSLPIYAGIFFCKFE